VGHNVPNQAEWHIMIDQLRDGVRLLGRIDKKLLKLLNEKMISTDSVKEMRRKEMKEMRRKEILARKKARINLARRRMDIILAERALDPPTTYEKIGYMLDLSKTRISQLHWRARKIIERDKVEADS
jgi:DNA-directed RNA polymerase sigma subunit (sigma70/sigma32)